MILSYKNINNFSLQEQHQNKINLRRLMSMYYDLYFIEEYLQETILYKNKYNQ